MKVLVVREKTKEVKNSSGKTIGYIEYDDGGNWRELVIGSGYDIVFI